MSTLNLGLQSVGLMRKEGSEQFEREVSRCGSLKTLRKAAEERVEFKEEALDSVEPVKILLTQVFERLQLGGKNIRCSPAASDKEI